MSVYARCGLCNNELKMGPIIKDISKPGILEPVNEIKDLLSKPECCGKEMILIERMDKCVTVLLSITDDAVETPFDSCPQLNLSGTGYHSNIYYNGHLTENLLEKIRGKAHISIDEWIDKIKEKII